MATAEADDDDGDGISCCTAAANECREVTIFVTTSSAAKAGDDGDGICCCTSAANECQPSDPTMIAMATLRDYDRC